MNPIKEQVLEEAMDEELLRDNCTILQENMLYDKTEKISLKWDENVNPEVDIDYFDNIIEGFVKKTIDLTLAKVCEEIESFTTMDRGNMVFKGGVTPEELLKKVKGDEND